VAGWFVILGIPAIHAMLSPSSSHALRAMSLDAIRGFESAARHLSFTAAAEELCITQSAVSKQIKTLEDALGKALFLRGGKGLSLTPQGRELYEAARAALAQLASAVDRLLAVDRASVAVTTTPSFAALWLAPKLAKFQQQEPAIDVRVDASEARVNLEREGMDPQSVDKALALTALSSGLYMAFSLQTAPDIVERCRRALRDMRRDGTLDKIKAAYLH